MKPFLIFDNSDLDVAAEGVVLDNDRVAVSWAGYPKTYTLFDSMSDVETMLTQYPDREIKFGTRAKRYDRSRLSSFKLVSMAQDSVEIMAVGYEFTNAVVLVWMGVVNAIGWYDAMWAVHDAHSSENVAVLYDQVELAGEPV